MPLCAKHNTTMQFHTNQNHPLCLWLKYFQPLHKLCDCRHSSSEVCDCLLVAVRKDTCATVQQRPPRFACQRMQLHGCLLAALVVCCPSCLVEVPCWHYVPFVFLLSSKTVLTKNPLRQLQWYMCIVFYCLLLCE